MAVCHHFLLRAPFVNFATSAWCPLVEACCCSLHGIWPLAGPTQQLLHVGELAARKIYKGQKMMRWLGCGFLDANLPSDVIQAFMFTASA